MYICVFLCWDYIVCYLFLVYVCTFVCVWACVICVYVDIIKAEYYFNSLFSVLIVHVS